MITIIAFDQSFGAAYNLKKAFSLWDDTRLITLTTHRLYPDVTDILLTPETASECKKLIEDSRFTMIADAAGLAKGMLETIGGPRWKAWAKKQTLIPFWGDTTYWKNAEYYNGLAKELKVKVTFAMMDVLPLAPVGTIPLCHPVEDFGYTPKQARLKVAHSPRTANKSILKGTDKIERVMNLIKLDHPAIEYETLVNLPYRDCLAHKRNAHIFIDQIPDYGQPAGLGRSGEEALAFGSVVLTALHKQEYLDGFFPPPPVVGVYTEKELHEAMLHLLSLDRAELEAKGLESRRWAEKYLLFEGWLDYVKPYLGGV